MLFSKRNYLLLLLSLVLNLIGFFLMAGGGSSDPQVFNPEIFSARRIIVAPLICLIGFLLIIYAILSSNSQSISEHKERK